MSAYSTLCLASTPKLYWRLNESAGPTAADASGNAHPGTYGSGVTFSQTGAISGDTDKAVKLNGTVNDYVTSTYAPFVVNSTRTFVVWVNRVNASANHSLLGAHTTPNTSPKWVLFSNTGVTTFFPNRNAGGLAMFNARITVAGWHMLALVYNDSAKTADFYLDGVWQGQQTLINGYNATAGNLSLGDNYDGQQMNGTLDEFAVFERGLSAAEIAGLYAVGAAAHQPLQQPTPTTPFCGFSWRRTTTLSVTNDAIVAIPFDDADVDTEGFTVPTSDQACVPYAGVWRFGFEAFWDNTNSTAGVRAMGISIPTGTPTSYGGAGLWFAWVVSPPDTGAVSGVSPSSLVTAPVRLQAHTFIHVQCSQNSGFTLALQANPYVMGAQNIGTPRFWGEYLGP